MFLQTAGLLLNVIDGRSLIFSVVSRAKKHLNFFFLKLFLLNDTGYNQEFKSGGSDHLCCVIFAKKLKYTQRLVGISYMIKLILRFYMGLISCNSWEYHTDELNICSHVPHPLHASLTHVFGFANCLMRALYNSTGFFTAVLGSVMSSTVAFGLATRNKFVLLTFQV